MVKDIKDKQEIEWTLPMIKEAKTISAQQDAIKHDWINVMQGILDNRGQFILVVERNESIHGCTGIGPPDYIDPMFYGLDEYLRLGVISKKGDPRISSGIIGNMIIPTKEYAVAYSHDQKEVRREIGNIKAGHYVMSISQLNSPIECRCRRHGRFGRGMPLALEIIVGDDAVNDWFELNEHDDYRQVFDKLCDALGRQNRIQQKLAQDVLIARKTALLRALNDSKVGELDALLKEAEDLGLHDEPVVICWRNAYKIIKTKAQ